MGTSDAADSAGFGKFIPGFDFLQKLAEGAGGMTKMPGLSSWIAPTMSVEELDKRIEELKNVQFWLEQNSRALAATVQALEVQKMTMATLKGMNFNLADVASAMAPRPFAGGAPANPVPAPEVAPEPKPEPKPEPTAAGRARKATKASPSAPSGMVDPLQLWGALTQQFQQIAASAVKEVAAKAGMPGAATKPSAAGARSAKAQPAPKKPGARKTATSTGSRAPRKRAAS